VEYYDEIEWRPMRIFHDLIHRSLIHFNIAAARAFQLCHFDTGESLDKPTIIDPVKWGPYFYLEITVPSSSTTTRVVRIKRYRLVYTLRYHRIPRGMQIHHIDGNSENDGLDNLVAIPRQEHVKINRQTGVYLHLNNQPLFSRDDPVVVQILQLHESGRSLREIAELVGYSYSTCQRIVSGTYPFSES
jgi:hypothetical protein